MTDVVIADLIGKLLADAAVTKVVRARVYKGHLSTIGEVKYPCLTLMRRTGRTSDRGYTSAWSLLVSAYSEDSDQAFELLEAADAVIKNAYGDAGGGRYYTIDPTSTPIDTVDAKATTVYGSHRVFAISQIS